MSYAFPKKITAGLTFRHSINLTAYPASIWSITIFLRGATAIDITAAKDGNLHIFNVPADTTKNYKAGHYGYSLRATDNLGDVEEIEAGAIEIISDLASLSDPIDSRTHAQKTLAALEAVIEGRATLDQEHYRLNNRELWRTPLTDLIKLRNQYRNEVAREQAKANGQNIFGKVIRVQLG